MAKIKQLPIADGPIPKPGQIERRRRWILALSVVLAVAAALLVTAAVLAQILGDAQGSESITRSVDRVSTRWESHAKLRDDGTDRSGSSSDELRSWDRVADGR